MAATIMALHERPMTSGSARALDEISSLPTITRAARIVPQKHIRTESQMMRTGVKMPTYTILRDPPPWETQDDVVPQPHVAVSAAAVAADVAADNNSSSSRSSDSVKKPSSTTATTTVECTFLPVGTHDSHSVIHQSIPPSFLSTSNKLRLPEIEESNDSRPATAINSEKHVSSSGSVADATSSFSPRLSSPNTAGSGRAMAALPPLQIPSRPDRDRAPPRKDSADSGVQSKTSRMPLFKQVRSMLQRHSPTVGTASDVKWDDYSGDISADGRAPYVKPSTYIPASASTASRGRNKSSARKQKRNLSPVSMLHEHEVGMMDVSRTDSDTSASVSPLSNSPTSTFFGNRPSDVSYDVRPFTALPSGLNQGLGQFRRKPAAPQNTREFYSQHGQHDEMPYSPAFDSMLNVPYTPGMLADNRLSWASYARSMTSSKPDTSCSESPKTREDSFDHNEPGSRFSWTTIATNTTAHARPSTVGSHAAAFPQMTGNSRSSLDRQRDVPDVPPLPSMLARDRPVPRIEKEDWLPQPNGTPITPRVVTAPVAGPKLWSSGPSSGGKGEKALPPPPELVQPSSPLTHLDSLVAHERDLALQHANVSKGIRDVEMLDRTSPLDVPFATIRSAKKRLTEYRIRLGEIELAQREVGILISRARRKGGMEEGLWVRRVTS